MQTRVAKCRNESLVGHSLKEREPIFHTDQYRMDEALKTSARARPTTFRHKALGLTLGLAAVAGLSVGIPASSASADCQVLGLSAVSDLEGVLCSSGSGGGGGDVAPGGPVSTGCRYDMVPLDESFEEFTADEYSDTVTTTSGGTLTTRVYEKNGKLTGTVVVRVSADNKAYTIWLFNKKRNQGASFDCMNSADGTTFQDFADDVESDTDSGAAPAAPIPSSTTPVYNPVAVSDWIVPVAGTENDYALKLGFTNTGSLATSVDTAYDMTALTTADVLSAPSGFSCSTKAGVKLCQIPQLDPGATATIFLRISAPAALGNFIPVTVLNEGSLYWKQSAAQPRTWANGPVAKTFLVTRP